MIGTYSQQKKLYFAVQLLTKVTKLSPKQKKDSISLGYHGNRFLGHGHLSASRNAVFVLRGFFRKLTTFGFHPLVRQSFMSLSLAINYNLGPWVKQNSITLKPFILSEQFLRWVSMDVQEPRFVFCGQDMDRNSSCFATSWYSLAFENVIHWWW